MNVNNERARPSTSGQINRSGVSASQQVTGISNQVLHHSNKQHAYKNKDGRNKVHQNGSGGLHIVGSNSQAIHYGKKDKNF